MRWRLCSTVAAADDDAAEATGRWIPPNSPGECESFERRRLRPRMVGLDVLPVGESVGDRLGEPGRGHCVLRWVFWSMAVHGIMEFSGLRRDELLT